jgi:hypothetical protein
LKQLFFLRSCFLEAGCWENEEGSSHSPAFLGFHLGLKVSMEARLTKQRLQDRETGSWSLESMKTARQSWV